MNVTVFVLKGDVKQVLGKKAHFIFGSWRGDHTRLAPISKIRKSNMYARVTHTLCCNKLRQILLVLVDQIKPLPQKEAPFLKCA